MKISSLELNNFRNYESGQIDFDDGVNILVGNNAQGKTNMLESIFLCAIGKSPRTTKEKELIRFGATFSKIILNIEKISGKKKIEFYIFDNQKKAIKINGMPIKKIGQLMGEFNAVYFSPDELKLVKESPVERRKFMDISLSQYDKNYFYNLMNYNKILMERNQLLKTTKNKSVLLDTLPIWNEQLSEVGAKIIEKRIEFLDKIKPFTKEIHTFLTDKKEDFDLSYIGIKADTLAEIKDKMLNLLTNSIDKDLSLGFTTIGPHRDDIKITSSGIDIRAFGSQGQQRTCALTLKLAELEFFKLEFNEYPVLLLDDVLSELDETRKLKLLEFVKKLQCIISCTHFDFNINAKIIKIKNGIVIK